MRAVGVIFQKDVAFFRENAVFVERVVRQIRDLSFPNTVCDLQHRVHVAVPLIEIADHGHIDRIRRPDAEHRHIFTVFCSSVGTEQKLCVVVLTLIEQMKRKCVGVLIVFIRICCVIHTISPTPANWTTAVHFPAFRRIPFLPNVTKLSAYIACRISILPYSHYSCKSFLQFQ